jgi:hypothetical protein
MGGRYFFFRLKHEFLRRSGLLADRFPVCPHAIESPGLSESLERLRFWPWEDKQSFSFMPEKDPDLELEVQDLMERKILLFGSIPFKLQSREDWHRHPETGFVYDKNLHWTKIPDLSPESGDIKFVWERGRFGYFQTLMRYDLQTGGFWKKLTPSSMRILSIVARTSAAVRK